MKILNLAMPALLMVSSAQSQGVLVLDQFSSTDEGTALGAGVPIQQFATPFGQSFTPSLDAVDFIRLNLNDRNPGNSLGATVYLTLHSDSMSGPVLGSTAPVFLLNGSATITTFFFPATVELTPNVTYFFEVLAQPGSDSWNIIISGYNYFGGSGFAGGVSGPGDLWFQEGIVVPEPSSGWLLLSGLAILPRLRRRRI